MALVKRIFHGHLQAFTLWMVILLCYAPMTLGLPILKSIGMTNTTLQLWILIGLILFSVVISPLMVPACIRAFGITLAGGQASGKEDQGESPSR